MGKTVHILAAVLVSEFAHGYAGQHAVRAPDECVDKFGNCNDLTSNGTECAGKIQGGNDIKVDCCESCLSAPACQDAWSNCADITKSGTDCTGKIKTTGALIADDCCASCSGSALPPSSVVSPTASVDEIINQTKMRIQTPTEEPLFTMIKAHSGDIDVRIFLEDLDLKNAAAFSGSSSDEPSGGSSCSADAFDNCGELTKMGEDCVGTIKETGNDVKVDCCKTCERWMTESCEDRWSNCEEITSGGTNCLGNIKENGKAIGSECCKSCSMADPTSLAQSVAPSSSSGMSASLIQEKRPLSLGRQIDGDASLLQNTTDDSASVDEHTIVTKTLSGAGSGSGAADDSTSGTPPGPEQGAFPEARDYMVQLVETHDGKVKVKFTLKNVKPSSLKMMGL